MATEIKVPALGESITEATVAHWLKAAGDAVTVDEPLVELETEKVTVEVPAPASGVLAEIAVSEGETVETGALLGAIAEIADVGAPPPQQASQSDPAATSAVQKPHSQRSDLHKTVAKANDGPVQSSALKENGQLQQQAAAGPLRPETPASEAEAMKPPSEVRPPAMDLPKAPTSAPPIPAPPMPEPPMSEPIPAPQSADDRAREERVKMSRLRQTIVRRLKEAQNTAAMLTTFNEVDMAAVIELRKKYQAAFQQKYGVKLGFMSFFIKACVNALKEIPAINAEIDGDEIVYKNYYHIGIAVGTDKGLVVPVVREADRLSLAEIERQIADFATRARAGKLTIDEMQGGTFTISNGGVYGSMMSTPILNRPQSGILGMHKIEDRAVVREGKITIRPMMYLALTYDHRIVDGKEAVTFLVRVKEAIEGPERLLLEV